MPTLCIEGLEFPMKAKDIPKFERLIKLNTGAMWYNCIRTHWNSSNTNRHTYEL